MSDWLNHFSVVGHLGKFGQKISDPLAMMPGGFGDKWSHLTSDILPAKVNEVGSHIMKPFEYVDKTINPVRKIPIVNRIGDIVANKPGDVGALVAGAYFGGGALMGGGGGGAGAGGGAVGSGGGYMGEVGLTGEDVGTGAAAEPGGGQILGGSSMPTSFQMGQQQQSHRPELTPSTVQFGDSTLQSRIDALQLPEDGMVVTSSRSAKTPVAAHEGSMRALAVMGASGRDKVSENGVHIGAIRALNKQIAQLEAVARKKGIKV